MRAAAVVIQVGHLRRVGGHVVEFAGAVAPDGVVEAVGRADEAERLVGVDAAVVGVDRVVRDRAPVLDRDVLPGLGGVLRAEAEAGRYGDGDAVEVGGAVGAGP